MQNASILHLTFYPYDFEEGHLSIGWHKPELAVRKIVNILPYVSRLFRPAVFDRLLYADQSSRPVQC